MSKGRQLVRKDGLFVWVSSGDLKAEIESEIIAAQTKYHTKKMLKIGTGSRWRLWQQYEGTRNCRKQPC